MCDRGHMSEGWGVPSSHVTRETLPKPLTVLATLLTLVGFATVPFASPVAGAPPDGSARELLHGKFVVVAADAARGESTAYFVKVRGQLYRLEGKQHYR